MENIKELEEIIAYSFSDKELLKTALTHSSYANEKRHQGILYNERLEFLGDSVLSLVVSKYLFENCKKLPEGDLTKVRAQVVCEKSLFECAKKIELGRFIMLGKGEELTGGRERASVLADAYEALIAAVYLDSDLETVREWLLKKLYDTIDLAIKGKSIKDYKTTLQEIVQGRGETDISYVITNESGPDHNKTFAVDVLVNGKIAGSGEGRSKKIAEQNAAKFALERFND